MTATSDPLSLVDRLRASADEVESFPHPSHCDHLHVAFKVMREAADALSRERSVVTDDLLSELWCRAALPSAQFRAKARELLSAVLEPLSVPPAEPPDAWVVTNQDGRSHYFASKDRWHMCEFRSRPIAPDDPITPSLPPSSGETQASGA